MQVTFFIPGEPDLPDLLKIDPDADWQRMRRRQRWLLQTYLRLDRAGCPVTASDRVPEGGIVVFHSKHKRALLKQLKRHHRPVLVGIRGDLNESLIADYEIVQNGHWADGKRRFFIPYWPQPGLIPRDPARETRVDGISFKGFDHNLHPYFASSDWLDWIHAENLTWLRDSMHAPDSEQSGVSAAWHDYRQVDAVLSFRPPPRRVDERRGWTSKPATKLYNAWHAGVPAILGPEVAYQESRKSELDYIEISEPEQAKAALVHLRQNAEVYQQMVQNGRQRAVEYSRDRILEHWKSFLFEQLPRQANGRPDLAHTLPFQPRIGYRWLMRRLAGRPAR